MTVSTMGQRNRSTTLLTRVRGGNGWRPLLGRLAEQISFWKTIALWGLRAQRAARLTYRIEMNLADQLRKLRQFLAEDVAPTSSMDPIYGAIWVSAC